MNYSFTKEQTFTKIVQDKKAAYEIIWLSPTCVLTTICTLPFTFDIFSPQAERSQTEFWDLRILRFLIISTPTGDPTADGSISGNLRGRTLHVCTFWKFDEVKIQLFRICKLQIKVCALIQLACPVFLSCSNFLSFCLEHCFRCFISLTSVGEHLMN